ncbi:MAG: UDP-3-O-(3-hydroxymyristoyl)glucosamine N-acyltransferase [Chthoniobacterales bacterium]|nr:UDP-3-O-(3-hydroxymyristoyl)glucosamine N-acyltransferase [Chthoniobacterales bacterium]
MPSLAEIAAAVGAELPAGFTDTSISGPASLADAVPGEISFFWHPRYAADLRATKASAVLVPRDFTGECPAVCIRVDNPSAAFMAVTQKFVPAPVRPEPGVHPAAVVAPGAQVAPDACVHALAVIGEGATVGPRSVIGSGCQVGRGAKIGADCLLHPDAVLRDGCVLGDRVILQSGAVIGSDGFGYDTDPKTGRHTKIPQIGIVVVGDDVEIGANTTVDRARFGRTVIGEGTKIDNLVMIAHNVVIGKHCIICAQVGIAGSAEIGNHVILAGQAGIVGHIKIGDGAIVGAQSGVSNDIPPKAQVVGSPPRPGGEWKRTVVRIDRLGELFSRVKKIEDKLG